MSSPYRLDFRRRTLHDELGRRLDPAQRTWHAAPPDGPTAAIDAVTAATWLQRESGHPLRVPIGVIGPRDATELQMATAREIGASLAQCGFTVLCGGRMGVMEAVCDGVRQAGGTSIGLIGDADASLGNPHATVILASGIGEARNAIIARAAFCLVCVGTSFGTLSEVALGRHFGKSIIGLEGAPDVSGVVHVRTPREALEHVAEIALARVPPA